MVIIMIVLPYHQNRAARQGRTSGQDLGQDLGQDSRQREQQVQEQEPQRIPKIPSQIHQLLELKLKRRPATAGFLVCLFCAWRGSLPILPNTVYHSINPQACFLNVLVAFFRAGGELPCALGLGAQTVHQGAAHAAGHHNHSPVACVLIEMGLGDDGRAGLGVELHLQLQLLSAGKQDACSHSQPMTPVAQGDEAALDTSTPNTLQWDQQKRQRQPPKEVSPPKLASQSARLRFMESAAEQTFNALVILTWVILSGCMVFYK